MDRIASFALCLGLLMGLGFTASALEVTVSPSSIGWSEQRWVDITVSNVPPGGKIELDLHVDADGNQQVGPNDVLLLHFSLQDGVTNALGATVMPADNDGQANGVITTRIPYFGVSGAFSLMRGDRELCLARKRCLGGGCRDGAFRGDAAYNTDMGEWPGC